MGVEPGESGSRLDFQVSGKKHSSLLIKSSADVRTVDC